MTAVFICMKLKVCYFSQVRNAHDLGVRGDFAKQILNIVPNCYYLRPQAVNSNLLLNIFEFYVILIYCSVVYYIILKFT